MGVAAEAAVIVAGADATAVVRGPRATELVALEELLLLLLFDILGMLLMGVVLIGLDTRLESDFMGDCSNNAASEEGAWNDDAATTGTIVGGTGVFNAAATEFEADCTEVPELVAVTGAIKREG